MYAFKAMAAMTAGSSSLEMYEGKDSKAACSRSTSVGSSTQAGRNSEQESSDLDLQDRTRLNDSVGRNLIAPPGLETFTPPGLGSFTPPGLEEVCLRQNAVKTCKEGQCGSIQAPPGLEDVTRAVATATTVKIGAANLTQKTSMLHRSPVAPQSGMPYMPPGILVNMPLGIAPMINGLPMSTPPPSIATGLMPPPPMQPPSLDTMLATAPPLQPPAQPPSVDLNPSFTSTSACQRRFLPAPPSQPPALDVQSQGPRLLPPPPLSNALLPLATASNGDVQPPPAQAPFFREDLEESSIPPPPAQAPALHLNDALLLPSVGSEEHALGNCKPCAFVHAKGCIKGSDCVYCHLCDAGEKKRRMREKRQLLRSACQQGWDA